MATAKPRLGDVARAVEMTERNKGKGKARPWLRPVVDVVMAIVYLLQMAPGKVGNPVHELAGLAFTALFVIHHLLNRGWVGRLGRSCGLRARVTFAGDVVLTACVAALAVTGVLMSRSAVPWAAVPAVAHVARPLHGCCAYLGLMLVSLHVGLHMRVLRGYAGMRGRPTGHRAATALVWAAALALGTWAFCRLGVAGKLAGRPSFPDGMTPLAVQLALHLALGLPFVLVGALIDDQAQGGARGSSGTRKRD